jgi:hypothetical protein
MFSNPKFHALGIKTARNIVPYDIVTRKKDASELRDFRAWYNAARAAHVDPLISFNPDVKGEKSAYIPSTNQYMAGVRAFLKAFPKIRTFTAWNEPDFPSRALARNPALAANYYNALVKLCPRCTVLAGDVFLPATGTPYIHGAAATLGPWLRAYIRGLHHKPVGWALHDYTEIRGHNTSQLRTLMSMTSGQIWLDETGGILHRGHWAYRNQSAAAAANDERYLLSVAQRYKRVTHIYHYEWQGFTGAGWDSGLLNPNGTARPAYNVLYSYMHPPKAKKKKKK